jgi:hypothetical protein
MRVKVYRVDTKPVENQKNFKGRKVAEFHYAKDAVQFCNSNQFDVGITHFFTQDAETGGNND